MDLLNLDELTELNRYVAIRGEQYQIVERSVGVLLDSMKVAKAAQQAGKNKTTNGKSEEVFFENMIKTIETIIPDCPSAVVRGLTMQQMFAVFEFANRDPNKMAEEAVNAQAGTVESDGAIHSEVEAPKS
jgi:CRISPR/Cas system CMR subunit Cmr6 (Cas7 group RAMP superfamily)